MKSPEGGVSVIVRAGDYESVHYALALAAAALAVNKPAVLFFTMAGIRALMGPPPPLDDWARDALNRERGVGDFETLLQACVELGARFIVCEMGLRSLGIDRAGLRADVPFTIAGIVTLLEETKPGMHLVSLVDHSGELMTSAAFDVLGIGNAIVDVISRADEAFLGQHGLVKGSMMLIDEARAETLYAAMGPGIEMSGGSCGNTMAGIASFGGKGAYIGKVRDDQLGDVFGHDLKADRRVVRDAARRPPGPATARCLILVTPDAQRTMNTYLGACTGLGPADIDAARSGSAQVTYVEGYLWDAPDAKKAVLKAFDAAHAAGRQGLDHAVGLVLRRIAIARSSATSSATRSTSCSATRPRSTRSTRSRPSTRRWRPRARTPRSPR